MESRCASALGVEVQVSVENALIGLVVARGVQVHAAPSELSGTVEREIEAANREQDDPETTRQVRDLLRYGKYKPTGRGKPASEYLRKAAKERRFPRLHPLVDINNLVSLGSRLPISLIDLERAATELFVLRRGRPGERYVFNGAGQTIELEDLLLVARLPEDVPVANPVKDSMATKISEHPRDVLAVLYGPPALGIRLREATERFAELVRTHSGSEAVEATVCEDRTS